MDLRRTSLVGLFVLVVLAVCIMPFGTGRGGRAAAAPAPADPGIHYLYADGCPSVWPGR